MANWTPLRDALSGVKTSVTFSWTDLEALVGDLPRSAYVHSAFWKGARSGWPGFTTADVHVGHAVTFVRSGSAPLTRKALSTRADAPVVELGTDVVLVACVKQKLDHPAPAKDLYTSDLFRKERQYAERSEVPWFVLSAKHGLVKPDEVLEPYDLHLARTSVEYRRSWGANVVEQLEAVAAPLEGKRIEVHAGAAYADALRQGLAERGVLVREPLLGLKLGPRLAWYRQRLSGDHAGTEDHGRIDAGGFVESLSERDQALSPAEFLDTEGAGLRTPGLYSWWVDVPGAADLSTGLGHNVPSGLIYAGLAGATRSRSGRKSKNTLWERIRGMHLGGRHEFSTFRLSLGSILTSARGDPEIDEPALTTWMHKHLSVVAIPFEDADTLGELETDVLRTLDPPLNLDKVAKNALRSRLSELRRQYGRKRRSG